MKIIGIIGTVFGSKTKIALNSIKFSENVDYEIIDLGDYNLPFADGRALNDYDNATINLINKISNADGLVIGSPIYQASIPGSLKNLFDLLPINSLNQIPVGMVVTSGSDKHYLVAQYQLIPILDYLKTDIINKYVYITQEDYAIDSIINDGIHLRLETLAKELKEKANKYIDFKKMFEF